MAKLKFFRIEVRDIEGKYYTYSTLDMDYIRSAQRLTANQMDYVIGQLIEHGAVRYGGFEYRRVRV